MHPVFTGFLSFRFLPWLFRNGIFSPFFCCCARSILSSGSHPRHPHRWRWPVAGRARDATGISFPCWWALFLQIFPSTSPPPRQWSRLFRILHWLNKFSLSIFLRRFFLSLENENNGFECECEILCPFSWFYPIKYRWYRINRWFS